MKRKEYEAYKAAVERNLHGLERVSTGICPGCEDCGLPYQCSEHELELAGEPCFSHFDCDCCGSGLAGNRYPAHGLLSFSGSGRESRMIHLNVCEDCLYYLNYGKLDDLTMIETEN